MKQIKKSTAVFFIVLFVQVCFFQIVFAQDIPPGADLFVTPPGYTIVYFNGMGDCPPLPADFFAPGSDPFDGVIEFEGSPLSPIPYVLGSTDTIVTRLETAELPGCGSYDEIAIEITALSLVSTQPIIVTYGGPDPELWDVKMCLSSLIPQPPGVMSITQECDEGGTFMSDLPMVPKFVFTRTEPPAEQRILDYGEAPAIILDHFAMGQWTYVDPFSSVTVSPGGALVDHDCDEIFDMPVMPGSNYFPGIGGSPCTCVDTPTEYHMTVISMMSSCGPHDMFPTHDVFPGDDVYKTIDANIQCSSSCIVVPADFFGPGSDPFEGQISLEGYPLEVTPPGILEPTDTIIRRLDPAEPKMCGDSDQVDIQIIALSLLSIDPITVTYNSGQDPEDWDVKVCLSTNFPQPLGSMTINQNCDDGGTFSALLPVIPKLIFTKDVEVRELDSGDMLNQNATGEWMYHLPAPVITSPGGLTTNHDCDGLTPEMPVNACSNFFGGFEPLPCDCITAMSNFSMNITSWISVCGDLNLIPPVLGVTPTPSPTATGTPTQQIPSTNPAGIVILILSLGIILIIDSLRLHRSRR